ncbi:MAG TPA: ABC transporter substrate-binding protein [Oscillospiraceae bacterium]|nr:ABC transporter substrate-binding protein [Oscillospiraceae bacterium]
MKKVIATILALTMSIGIFTGCSSPSSSSSSKSVASAKSPAEDKTPVTLRVQWWGGDDRHAATLKAIDAFQKKYPWIKIKAEYGGWDGHKDKVTTQISGGTAADVLQVNYDWLSTFSRDGTGFYDLEKLNKIIDLTNWDETSLKFGRSNGVLNAIPVSNTGRSLFYNKTTFDKLGVAIPNSWDSLIEAGQQFKAKDPNKYPFDLDTGTGFPGLYMAVVYEQQKTGKEFLSQDGKLGMSAEELKDALDFYKKLEDNHVIRTQKQRMNDGGETALYQTSKFIDGSVAGVLEWGSSVGKYADVLTKNKNKQELVLGELPMLKDAKSTGWFMKPSLLFAINGKTKYPEQSALFLNWLLNDPESSKILGSTRGIPSSKAALAALKGSKDLEGLAYKATEQIANSKPSIVSPYMENTTLQKIYKTAIESVSYGKADTAKASQTLYNQMNSALKGIAKK